MTVDLPRDLVTAIDHVGIAVADMEAAKAFYRETFGMETVHEEVNEEQGVLEAMVRVGPAGDASGAMIQLLAPLDESSTIARFLDRFGPGIQQLAYRVTDVEAFCDSIHRVAAGHFLDAPVARLPRLLLSPLFTSRPWKAALFNTVSI